ncbi:MAG: SO_0444 family Cu/Zn efflux transporter [Phycisphaeraceae bacterium]
MLDFLSNGLRESWLLLVAAAPYFLVGCMLAGGLKAWVPTAALVRWVGGRRFRSVFNASLIGLPLPLCSCSVLPMAALLRKQGASRGATTSFLISTPESGVDSIALSWGLLGPFLAIVRPVAALATALTAGVMENVWGARTDDSAMAAMAQGCCGDQEGGFAAAGPRPSRWRVGLRFAVIDLFEDIGLSLMVGVAVGGMLAVALARFELESVLSAWYTPLAVLVVAIPMYICASAATPLAAALMAAGLSPGAALVLLLAGPATNTASILVLAKALGVRSVVIYLLAVIVCSLLAGFGLNLFCRAIGWEFDLAAVIQTQQAGVFSTLAAVVVLLLSLHGIWRQILTRLYRVTV